MRVTARNSFAPILLAAGLAALLGGCAKKGEIDLAGGVGITAVRSACPSVGVPASTGDITLFDPPASRDAAAIDVTALMTNVRSTCNEEGADIQTNVTFDIRASRINASAARDVTLPYFIAIVRGGTAVTAKRIGRVTIHFDAGQTRASTNGQASTNISRAAATLPDDIRKKLTEKRKAGDDDAAVDPLSRPDIRQAVKSASFEALVGFQLTDDQLKYNATR
ncbi:hypothetical protein ASG11_14615 [Sphingomonas sp. Leaf357]|uniref:hypothetical protein n=1 Tax=Sphingomonas sp. Leaf357 TaxID=1736350 RepID=UPI0006F459F8|nr:hypothetical protein [Sphingomonas sp. Leaf357]KQS02033.1 hypothetical protein ASG11_14615 [Sphingomonas sp. Leaf357]